MFCSIKNWHLMYTGRFAPTPSGPLHLGSLSTAIGSFLRARSQKGKWLLRIEDLDRQRCSMEASDSILKTLEIYGLEYDGCVIYQSRQVEKYREIIRSLQFRNLVYKCSCSRKRIKALGGIYDGRCRNTVHQENQNLSVRFRNPGTVLSFDDIARGHIETPAAESGEDFVLLRSDGTVAYNLAVVADDETEGVTEIVRGADLIPVTTRQLNLISVLGYRTPVYMHLPLILSGTDLKYSKQNHAKPVNESDPSLMCATAMKCLGLILPPDLCRAPPREQLSWGIKNFRIDGIPRNNQTVSY